MIDDVTDDVTSGRRGETEMELGLAEGKPEVARPMMLTESGNSD